MKTLSHTQPLQVMKNIAPDPESHPVTADARRHSHTSQTPSASSPRRLPGALVLAGLCAAFLCWLAPGAARAADANPPGKLTYQGFLTDGSGVPYGNTAPVNQAVVFRIWKKATGTTSSDLVWAEWQTVTIDKGHFSVLLGEGAAEAANAGVFSQSPAITSFSGSDASDRFMEIALANSSGVAQTIISPRLQFQPAPYAALSRSARQVVDDGGNAVLTATGGNVTFTGNVTGNKFNGDGSGLTGLTSVQIPSLDASKVNSGTFSLTQIPSLDTSKINSGILPISRGGTGSGSQNFVDLSTQQTYIRGNKSFYNYVAINGNSDTVPRQALDVFGTALIRDSLGVGTTSPGATLDVRGNIKLGPSGQFFAPGGEENLRIVRGAGTANTTVGTVNSPISGSGFTYKKLSQGVVEVIFNTPFAGTPTVTGNPISDGAIFCGFRGPNATGNPNYLGFTIVMYDVNGNGRDWPFNFIAVGPR